MRFDVLFRLAGLAFFLGLVAMGSKLVAAVGSGQGTYNWPQWRGPAGSGISSERDLPLEWSPTKNVKWKTKLPGKGHSSPIVWGNRLFITTEIEGGVVEGAQAVRHVRNGQEYRHPDAVGADREHELRLLCVDVETGKVLWDRTLHQGTVYDDRHRKNTYASPTPATDGTYVFAFFDAEGIFCFDFNGKRIWKKSPARIAKGGMGPGTSPVLFDNLVILQCDQEYGEGSFIAGLEKATGKEVWRVPRKHRRTWATPLVVRNPDRPELIASGAESVISYDPATGKELWHCEGVVSNPIPSPVSGHNIVVVSAGSAAKRAIAVRLGGSGNLTGTNSIAWKYDKGTAYVPSPILYDDYLYLMTDSGIITCLDVRTGEVKYSGGRVPVPASFKASPVAFDGKILLSSEDGDTFIVKAGPVFEIIGTNSIGEPVYSSPAISNGKIFIRGDKHLYCIAKR
jgi:outer membrane protein assembly factor BamB